jgi:hypothetical protein
MKDMKGMKALAYGEDVLQVLHALHGDSFSPKKKAPTLRPAPSV